MAAAPLTREDREFLHGHARAYARPDLDPARADAYAAWYTARYATDPDATWDDLPAHPSAWLHFTGERAAVPPPPATPLTGDNHA